jgi:DNA-binding PucR family transcriptional regulator
VATDPAELLATIAAAYAPRARELADALIAQILDEQPELSGDQPLIDSLTTSVQDNVATVLRVFEIRPDPASVPAPPTAIEYARRLAQRGIPISALLRAYRLGQAGFQQALLPEIAKGASDLQAVAEAAAVLATVSFDYVDRISEDVVAAYQHERDNWMRNRITARSARVMALLTNARLDLGEVEKTLGYRLGQTHVGVIAWSDDAVAGGDQLSRLERSIGSMAEAAGSSRAPLFIAPDESTLWAWLPRATSAPFPLQAPADDAVWIAVGEPAVGVEGFRLTHRQARQAQFVALAADPGRRARVTESAQVGAIALMCGDREALAAWVQETLGGLALDDEGMGRLRETLSIFLTSGGSFTASAQKLLLHKNTVQYRVRKAEDAIGRPLQDRRLDVELALQACHWLGSVVLRPAAATG